MICGDANNLIMKFFDQEINDIENLKLKQHLKVCCRCRMEMDNYKSVFEMVEDIAFVEPPEDLEEKVLKKVNLLGVSRRKRNDKIVLSLFVVGNLLLAMFLLMLINFRGSLVESMYSLGLPEGIVWFTYKVLQSLDGIAEMFKYLLVTVYYEIANPNSFIMTVIIVITVMIGIRDKFKPEKHINYSVTQERSI